MITEYRQVSNVTTVLQFGHFSHHDYSQKKRKKIFRLFHSSLQFLEQAENRAVMVKCSTD